MRQWAWRNVFAIVGCIGFLLLLTGCPHLGLIDDGTSVSYGPANRGALFNPQRLPQDGEGFRTPSRWANRGLRYGTDEMIALIAYAGRQLSTEDLQVIIDVADISQRHGGPSAWHRSHQTGRDVDLLFFATDTAGTPVQLDAMVPFDENGIAFAPTEREPQRKVLFDIPRNWRLVRILLDNPIAEIQHMFVSDPLRQLLLDYARAIKEPEGLIEKASYILKQPTGALPHDDHMHVRTYCAPDDIIIGCSDHGVRHWLTKFKRNMISYQYSFVSSDLLRKRAAPMPVVIVLGTLSWYH